MKKMHKSIKQAVDVSQRAQRNFDLTSAFPLEDLETLIYVASQSPSKQNETHYELHVFTDQKIIRQIYNTTKRYLLYHSDEMPDNIYGEHNGEFWQSDERSVHNSQVLANALFVYFEHQGEARGGTHAQAQTEKENNDSKNNYKEQINYSIGTSSGQLAMSAALLGYKTGFCSAFRKGAVSEICGTRKKPKLLVGVGYPNDGVNRRIHAETVNKDIPKGFETGPPNDKWQFPSFDKNIDIYLDNEPYKHSI